MDKLLNQDKFNKRYRIIAVILCLVSIALGVIYFRHVYARFILSCKEFGLSLYVYVADIFGIETDIDIKSLINSLPILGGTPGTAPSLPLPSDPDEFVAGIKLFFNLLVDANNFAKYLIVLIDVAYNVTVVLSIVIPLFVMFKIMLKKFYLEKENNDYNVDSKALQLYKKAVMPFGKLAKVYKGFKEFLSENSIYIGLLAVIWLFNLNIINIIISFFGYYFYLFSTFDFVSLYYQLLRIIYDLKPAFTKIPLVIQIYIGLKIFGWLRRKIGLIYLNYTEARNQEFVESQPIVVMLVGTMGKGKTQALTDMLLSQSIIFRNKAYELILSNDLKFPNFPFIKFEKELERRINLKKNYPSRIFNLATCVRYVKELKSKFDLAIDITEKKEVIFGYDYERYGISYDDKLKNVDLFDVLKNYAKLYFIFICESFVVSNFAIKENIDKKSLGNFPNIDIKLFDVDTKYIKAHERHSYILDFDCLRLGKTVVENNKYKDALEFGVIAITEIGKERGNMIENRGLKKTSEEANATNDMLNLFIKLSRHLATIDGFPFIRILTDDQRPESWGADARDLTKILHVDTGEFKLHMPFFILEELAHNASQRFFNKIYKDYRYYRGDNTLFMHLLKNGYSYFNKYYNGMYNEFSGAKVRIKMEEGTQDGKKSKIVYYLNKKKIYADRYNTDCFSDLFEDKAMRSATGLMDLIRFKNTKATVEEFSREHSYFFSSMKECLKEAPLNDAERLRYFNALKA